MSSRSFHVPPLSVDWANTRQVTKSLMDTRSIDIFTLHIRQESARSLSLEAFHVLKLIELDNKFSIFQFCSG